MTGTQGGRAGPFCSATTDRHSLFGSQMSGAQSLLFVVLTFARARLCAREAVLGPQPLPSPLPRNRVLTQSLQSSHPQGRGLTLFLRFPLGTCMSSRYMFFEGSSNVFPVPERCAKCS